MHSDPGAEPTHVRDFERPPVGSIMARALRE